MVIYHHAKELSGEAAVGSAVRPARMREAFQRIGEEVIDVTGSGPERIRKAAELERRLESLDDSTVFYSESVNTPPALTWLRKRPWKMGFDYRLMRRLHDRGIPTGLFYRDIYWVFEESKAVGIKSFIRHRMTPAFARHELRAYESCLDVLFLPHEQMAKFVPYPFPNTRMRSLPPGGELRDVPDEASQQRGEGGKLQLLYVGNIAPPHYDLRPYVEAVESVDCAQLQIVTRERAMQFHGQLYNFEQRANITVTHAHGDDLVPLYQQADLSIAVRDDSEYLAYCMPVKIFEAISFGVPLVVSAGSRVVAELVERERIGWVIQSPEEFTQLLQRLAAHPEEMRETRRRILAARDHHTWEARAREVVEVLRAVRGASTRA